MLDAVVDYLPEPARPAPHPGHKPERAEELEERKADDDEPFAALAFKIMTDPYVGKLTYVRVYSGTLEKGATVLNSTKDKKERVGRILQMHANHREDRGRRLRRRHRRRGRPQAHHHRRHPVRPGATRSCSRRSTSPSRSSTWPSSPRPRPTRTSCPGPCYALSEEDPTFQVRTRRGDRPDRHRGHGRAAPRGPGRPHAARVHASTPTSASPRWPTARPSASAVEKVEEPLRPPDRWSWPVRPRGHQPRAHRPRRGLRVRRQDHRRRHPQGVHPLGRRRDPGGPAPRASWPGTRSWTSGSP